MGCCGNMSMRRGGFGAGYVYKYMGSVATRGELPEGYSEEQFGYIFKILDEDGAMVIWDNDRWSDITDLQGPRGFRGEKGDKGDKGDRGEKGEKGEDGNDIEARNMASDAKKSAQDAYYRADDAHDVAVIARNIAANADNNAANALSKAELAKNASDSAIRYTDDSIRDLQELTILPLEEKTVSLENRTAENTKKIEGKANSGQTLASMEELEALPLPGDVSVGVVYTVVEKVPNKPCLLVTGKFSDCFSDSYGDGVYYEIELGSTYSEYFMKDGWVVDAGGYGTYVYNADDYSYVGAFSNGVASGCEVTNLHGYRGNPTDEVSFYICSEEGLEVSQKELAFYYNGNEWVELAAASAIGDIDAALDAILALDEKLLGGDA